jgi:Transglycosylase-like domain
MKRLLVIVAAAGLIGTPAAFGKSTFGAHRLSDGRVGSSRQELVAQRDFSAKVIARLAGSWRVAPRHATCWSHVPWARTCDRARRRLLAHRWLYKVAVSKLDRLYPAATLPTYLVADFMCIHRFEGAWDANTGNGYYGGLQMDARFMALYGAEYVRRWGTADNWPVWAQLQAAVRAYRSGRGFGPWPRTAVACGLL